jgi:tetratricopeptide (TPR) repeat protein
MSIHPDWSIFSPLKLGYTCFASFCALREVRVGRPAQHAEFSSVWECSMIKFNRLKPSLIVLAAGLALATVPASLFAQTGNEWIGKRVVQKANGFNLRIENRVVDTKNMLLTYKVEQVNGPWLWLNADGLKGWALASEVVPVEQAIEHFTNAIRANPADWFAYTMRAIIWKEKKELDIALGDLNEALRLDPSAASSNNRGAMREANHEYDKAIADFAEAIRLNPQYAAAYRNRGIAWHAKKDYDKAIADFAEAIRLDPQYAAAYDDRGRAWHAKKDYDRAIADYNEAIRLDPQYAFAYRGRAWLWATCPDAKYRDSKKAVESATKACQLSDWKKAYNVGTLAAACAESGDFDSAVKWQTKGNALYSDDDKSKYGYLLKLYQDNKPYRDTEP